MSVGVARVPVLPRTVAAAVSVFAAVRCAWVIAAIILLVCVPGVLMLLDRHHYTDALAEPMVGLTVMMLALAVAALHPRAATLVVYIVVGGVGN